MSQQAYIPCDIDERCGPVYLITWSKNSNKEWQRVYLYSETYQTALGDLAADERDRVKVDSSNITSLVIKTFESKDEGFYKCDVTYVQGSCPSLTFTQLVALGKNLPLSIIVSYLLVFLLDAWFAWLSVLTLVFEWHDDVRSFPFLLFLFGCLAIHLMYLLWRHARTWYLILWIIRRREAPSHFTALWLGRLNRGNRSDHNF